MLMLHVLINTKTQKERGREGGRDIGWVKCRTKTNAAPKQTLVIECKKSNPVFLFDKARYHIITNFFIVSSRIPFE